MLPADLIGVESIQGGLDSEEQLADGAPHLAVSEAWTEKMSNPRFVTNAVERVLLATGKRHILAVRSNLSWIVGIDNLTVPGLLHFCLPTNHSPFIVRLSWRTLPFI